MNLKARFDRIQKFVHDHRVALAVTGTSTFWIWVMVKRAEQWNEFLEEHNLTTEFYRPENDD